jgi:hypothetical protein
VKDGLPMPAMPPAGVTLSSLPSNSARVVAAEAARRHWRPPRVPPTAHRTST